MTKAEKKKLREMYQSFSDQVVKNQVDIMAIIHQLQGRITDLDVIHGKFMKEHRKFIPQEVIVKEIEEWKKRFT